MNRFTITLLICVFLINLKLMNAQDNIIGNWEGNIIVPGKNIGIKVSFEKEADSILALFDIPEQSAIGLRLINIVVDLPKVKFEYKSDKTGFVFDGELEGDSLKGAYVQGTFTGKFELVRVFEKEKKSKPYDEEEVVFYNGKIKLGGTLTIPKKTGKYPAVILVTGSGAQNRNEEIFGFKIFEIIADHLTTEGIAVLRYDDRGVGKSNGDISNSTTFDFAEDVKSAVSLLRKHNKIDPDKIGILGHSEGGIVAPLVAKDDKRIAFSVMMAGTALPGDSILMLQTKAISQVYGLPEEKIEASQKVNKLIYESVKYDTNLDTVKKELAKFIRSEIEKLPEDQLKAITNIDNLVNTQVTQTLNSISSAWIRNFIKHDPRPTLEKVKSPILALFGENDLQVPPKENKNALKEAFKKSDKTNYKIIIFPKANHLFQESETGNPNNYGKLEKKFVDGFLETISGWILEVIK